MILSFELTMPNVNTWNGRWSGQRSKFYIHKNVLKQVAKNILGDKEQNEWYYAFGDGWVAKVSVIKVSFNEKNKRKLISKGFAGYDWMVDEILKYGKILEYDERKKISK